MSDETSGSGSRSRGERPNTARLHVSLGPLVRVCAWCGRRLRDDGTAGEPFVRRDEVLITHGICRACAELMDRD
jgi:hypothetical protein